MNIYNDIKNYSAYWNDDITESTTLTGKYVVISGNTGAGKSTLVNRLSHKLQTSAIKAIGVNERILHHPLLKMMFSSPKEYSFLIQLNFLIQQHLILYRWLSIGYTVIIERSHLDDELLFFENHYEQGHISLEEYNAYKLLSSALKSKIPDPHMYIFLDAEPSLSLERLAKSEEIGERPKEFPNEKVKIEFVTAWYQKYNSLYEKLLADKDNNIRFQQTVFIKWPAETPTEIIANQIIDLL